MSRSNFMKQLEAELESCGLPYEIRNGGKHRKLFIAGRMVNVLPHSPHDKGSVTKNLVAHVRRSIRQLKEGKL